MKLRVLDTIPRKPFGFWKDSQNTLLFLKEIKKKYNLQTPKDWNSITTKEINSNGGQILFNSYSMYEIKCLGCPEGKFLFKKRNPSKPKGYWKDKENILNFLSNLKEKFNFNSPEEWNLLSIKQIKSHGGNQLLSNYSMYELKCMACPEGKSIYNNPNLSKKHFENKENVIKFLNELKMKHNLNSSDDWKLIKKKHISFHGGKSIFEFYSLLDLKHLLFPEESRNSEKDLKKSSREMKTFDFLDKIREKYNLQSIHDWNSLTSKQIQSNGGNQLLTKYSLYELKCLACPDGKFIFNKPNRKKGFWDNEENIKEFLEEIKISLQLKTPEDWNSVTHEQIKLHGGAGLLSKYSIYDLKCIACPDGKLLYKTNQSKGFWDDKCNILTFLNDVKDKFNFNSPEDWNLLSQKHIKNLGGNRLLAKHSLYELKCMACPEGKLIFTNHIQPKPTGYWDNKENIIKFLDEIKEKYNLQTIDDWNSVTYEQIKLNGGSRLLFKYSLFEIKCIACPEGKLVFNQQNPSVPMEYWNDENNRNDFFENLRVKFNLETPDDWKRLSVTQLLSNGGRWLFYNNNEYLEKCVIKFEVPDTDENTSMEKIVPYRLKDLISGSNHKRSSQRWLFLQIQKLFPGEEIVEDYFHSEISRETGFSVQFDIFLIERNIAVEYHGRHHYEDIPQGFAPLEMHQNRDEEKEKLCSKYGIKLIVIPYWWNNKLDSLRETLNSAKGNDFSVNNL